MFFDIILLLIIVVSQLLLARFILENFRKDREYIRSREEQFILMIKDVNGISLKIAKTQSALDDRMKELATLMGRHSAIVDDQQTQFDALARADMLDARRNELVRVKELKVALERLMSSALVSRQPPASNDVFALENVTKRIEELEVIING